MHVRELACWTSAYRISYGLIWQSLGHGHLFTVKISLQPTKKREPTMYSKVNLIMVCVIVVTMCVFIIGTKSEMMEQIRTDIRDFKTSKKLDKVNVLTTSLN